MSSWRLRCGGSFAWLALLQVGPSAARAQPPPPSAAETKTQEAAGKAPSASGQPAAQTKPKTTTQQPVQHDTKPKTVAKPSGAAPPKAAATATRTSGANPTHTQPAASSKAPSAAVLPAVPATAAKAPSAASAQVTVPSTAHVHVEIPAGLQGWLDADDRMRPWLSKAISVVDACYAELRSSDPSASGTATFSVTMHENARPSASVGSLPGPLEPLVLCVTTRLIGVKMPLFTGDEGASYTVRVRFTG
jgi:hypothetical protein